MVVLVEVRPEVDPLVFDVREAAQALVFVNKGPMEVDAL
jgi:hypothetical protein